MKDINTDTIRAIATFSVIVTKSFVDASSLAPLTEECELVYNDGNDCKTNYIDYVELEDILFRNDSCVFGGYQDLTMSGYTTELDMGLNYTLTLKPKNIFLTPTGDTSTLYYGVWLDYNNDGDFLDPGELIRYGESNRLTANLINIQILNNTSYAGPRRLRVAMRGSGGFDLEDACTVVGVSGEIEDYLVTINETGALYGPNLLTPNGDGKNDFLVIKGLDPDLTKSRTLTVFDSFGRPIRKIENYNNDFDGRNNDGELPSSGVYYYQFQNESRKLNSYYQLAY
jgi:gliding motility-associated-like protein